MSPTSSESSPDERDARDLARIVQMTSVVLLAAIAISWRIFVPGHRIFLPSPVFASLSQIPDMVQYAIIALCGFFIGWLCISPKNYRPAFGVLSCMSFFMLQDINRMQPYFYMYCFTIFAAACSPRNKNAGLDALRIMISGVYFWAGFHKFNLSFYSSTFPWFVEPFFTYGQPSTSPIIEFFFEIALFITPYFEALIGVLLLFPKWRRMATAMAFTMLAVVLICLGPLGHNWGRGIWLWNVYFFVMELVLFMNTGYNRNAPFLLFSKFWLSRTSILLFVLAPSLAIVNLWYTRLGFKLYSGNAAYAEVLLPSDETLAKAPEFLRNLVSPNHILDMTLWTGSELQNIPYPVPYTFKIGGAGLCPYLDYPARATLKIYYPPPFYTTRKKTEEVPLCP